MTTKRDYEIGHGKPPKHAQWKKGQSGNPKGRPRRNLQVGVLVAEFLGQRIVVRKGKTTTRMTRLQHLVHRLFEQALAGDPRILKMALDEARRSEARADESADFMGPADHEVLQALYRRLAGATQAAAE